MPAETQQLGRLTITLNRARNLRPDLLGTKDGKPLYKDCYIVFTFEDKRMESEVKYGTVAPVWNQKFVLDNVLYPPTSKVAITVVYKGDKKDKVLGTTTAADHMWSIGSKTPVDKWLPFADKNNVYAGEINFNIHWTKYEPQQADGGGASGGAVLKPIISILLGLLL